MTEKRNNASNVPTLRFPEFTDEWIENSLGEIARFSKGKGISKADITNEGQLECIRYGELYTCYNEVIDEVKSRTNLDRDSLILSEANDVIIPASGETQLDIATASCVIRSNIALGGDLNIIKTPHNGVFLSYYLNSRKKLDIASLSQGNSVVHLYAKQLSTLKISIPSKKEQDKIAAFLALLDQRIKTQNKIIEQLESLIKGIGGALFSLKLRFKNKSGKDYSDWRKLKLKEVLIKHEEKTQLNNQYPVLTSARTGLYFQRDYFDGNEVASKDNTGYNVVPKGYFTYRHMSDDITFKFNINTICEKGIVSTLYPVFTTVGVNNYFLQTYLNEGSDFKNYAIMQKQGGSRTYMYFSKLTELQLAFPCAEEQDVIADFLSSIDSKIHIEHKALECYLLQKKYLLDKLFI